MHRILILGFALFVFVQIGCNVNMITEEGNGIRETRELNFDPFDDLEISGNFKVSLVPLSTTDGHRVVIDADENLHEYIKIEREGSTLKVRWRNNINISSKGRINLTIYVQKLSSIEMAGSGDLVGKGLFENDSDMEFTVAGSGNINLELKSPKVEVSIGGSGKVSLEGKTREVEVAIGGSGDFLSPELLSEKASISIGGSGNAKVYASIDLEVNIAGSGNVYYGGSPKIERNIMGSGKVKPLE